MRDKNIWKFSLRIFSLQEIPVPCYYINISSNCLFLSGLDSLPVPSALQGLVNPEVNLQIKFFLVLVILKVQKKHSLECGTFIEIRLQFV